MNRDKQSKTHLHNLLNSSNASLDPCTPEPNDRWFTVLRTDKLVLPMLVSKPTDITAEDVVYAVGYQPSHRWPGLVEACFAWARPEARGQFLSERFRVFSLAAFGAVGTLLALTEDGTKMRKNMTRDSDRAYDFETGTLIRNWSWAEGPLRVVALDGSVHKYVMLVRWETPPQDTPIHLARVKSSLTAFK